MTRVAEACDGVAFESKSSNPISPIIKSMTKERNSREKLKKDFNERDSTDYMSSLLSFSIPWVVLFILSLIALYFF